MHRTAAAAVLLLTAACATTPAVPKRPPAGEAAIFVGATAAGFQGSFETGRISKENPAIVGPFVLTALGPGDEVEIRPVDGKGPSIGTILGPLSTPFEIPANVKLVLAQGTPSALYSGTRPMSITRALEAYLNRNILVALPGAPAEAWMLRQLGSDHFIIERNRTYRALPVRRIGEVTWTDLSGIDPTPKVVISGE
jgi:hypothetical protein